MLLQFPECIKDKIRHGISDNVVNFAFEQVKFQKHSISKTELSKAKKKKEKKAEAPTHRKNHSQDSRKKNVQVTPVGPGLDVVDEEAD